MPTPEYYSNKNNNNPTKEIWATSGIYDQKNYATSNTQYAPDVINSPLPNTGINNRRTETLTSPVIPTDSELFSAPPFTLSSGNYFIDDMEIFNPYRHYIDNSNITFDPQVFLKQTINVFNVYNVRYRV